MSDEFLPVSDDRENPNPSETGFADSSEAQPFEAPVEASVDSLVEDSLEAVEVPTLQVSVKPSLWEQFRQWWGGSPESLSRRIRDLDLAIEIAPGAAANYVLRGELYLQSREYELALLDFEQGLELAEAQYEDDDWGIVAQAVQDRALAGIQKVARRLKKRSAR